MSAVSLAISMIWLRYLPRPSWTMPLDGYPEVADLVEDERVVRLGVDRLAKVLADLVLVDIERGHELDVADVVTAEVDVHAEAGDEVVDGRVLVVIATLDEAARAVAHAHDATRILPSLAGPRPPTCSTGSCRSCRCRSCRWCSRLLLFGRGRGRLLDGLCSDMEDPLGRDGRPDRDDRGEPSMALDVRGPLVRTRPIDRIWPDLARHDPHQGHAAPGVNPRPSDLARA